MTIRDQNWLLPILIIDSGRRQSRITIHTMLINNEEYHAEVNMLI